MSSRWQYSTSCWFLLPVLSLVVFGSWPFPPFIISEVLPGAIVVPACGGHWCYLCHWHHCLGHQDWRPFCHLWGLLCSRLCYCGKRVRGMEEPGSREPLLCLGLSGLWEPLLWTKVGRKGTSKTRGQGHGPRSHCCWVPCGHRDHCGPEAEIACTTPLMLWCSLGR